MDREEFRERFEGKKVRRKGWKEKSFVSVDTIGESRFAGVRQDGEVDWFSLHQPGVAGEWVEYKEPAPEFDWDAAGMWGKSNGGTVVYLVKVNPFFWAPTDKDQDTGMLLRKEKILEVYDPCPPPDDAAAYGVDN